MLSKLVSQDYIRYIFPAWWGHKYCWQEYISAEWVRQNIIFISLPISPWRGQKYFWSLVVRGRSVLLSFAKLFGAAVVCFFLWRVRLIADIKKEWTSGCFKAQENSSPLFPPLYILCIRHIVQCTCCTFCAFLSDNQQSRPIYELAPVDKLIWTWPWKKNNMSWFEEKLHTVLKSL